MRTLWVLRPEPGATRTFDKAEACGLPVRKWPLFAIEPVAWTMPEGAFDGLLLTSANAVRHVPSLPDLPVYAVGEATAAAARAAGADVIAVGNGGVTELLPSLDPGLRLLHLAGEDRAPTPEQGPTVTAVTVYRACPLSPPPPAVLHGAVLMIHSPAAGCRIHDILTERHSSSIAAISPAAATACGSGWKSCESAEQPTDDCLLSLAARLCKEQP